MSCRVDTSSLITGACVVGNRGLGIVGAEIMATTATGDDGAGFLYNDLTSADDAKEIRGLIVTPPSSGTFTAYEDGSFSMTGTSGAFSFTYQLYVDGVAVGTASVVMQDGAVITTPTITTEPFKSYDGTTLTGHVIPHVLIVNPATAAIVATLENQTTAGNGALSLQDPAIASGQTYLVVSFNDSGAARGAKAYTAA